MFLDGTSVDVYMTYTYTYLFNACVYLQGFGQNIRLFLGLIAEVIADPPELYTFGSYRVHSIVVALDQLVTVQCMELGLFKCGLEK